MSEGKYSIAELATLGGVSRRTVRYYVQRGLIPAPLGTGRGKHYDDEHLAKLVEVRTAQERGVSLADIAGGASEPIHSSAPTGEVASQAWVRFLVADGIELHVRSDRLDTEDVAALQGAIDATLRGKERG